ncbi:MAG: hypothetical protein GX621_08395 [Pirellulaceae bacterium]|nr:hypothetical protein [Pirellulaceae bacterium]
MEERPFQFGIGSMLVATSVLAAVLSLLKCVDCPTIVIVIFLVLLTVEVLVVAALLFFDAVWARIGGKRKDTDKGNTRSDA